MTEFPKCDHPNLPENLPKNFNRRAFLLTSCSAAGLAMLHGCTTTFPGEFGSVKASGCGTTLSFDIAQVKYSPLATVGGMMADDCGVILVRTATDKVQAYTRLCPHQQADLAPDQFGSYDTGSSTIQCSLHGSVFDLTGKPLSGPALTTKAALKSFAVQFDPKTGKGTVSL